MIFDWRVECLDWLEEEEGGDDAEEDGVEPVPRALLGELGVGMLEMWANGAWWWTSSRRIPIVIVRRREAAMVARTMSQPRVRHHQGSWLLRGHPGSVSSIQGQTCPWHRNPKRRAHRNPKRNSDGQAFEAEREGREGGRRGAAPGSSEELGCDEGEREGDGGGEEPHDGLLQGQAEGPEAESQCGGVGSAPPEGDGGREGADGEGGEGASHALRPAEAAEGEQWEAVGGTGDGGAGPERGLGEGGEPEVVVCQPSAQPRLSLGPPKWNQTLRLLNNFHHRASV